jgi:hypothetical protein
MSKAQLSDLNQDLNLKRQAKLLTVGFAMAWSILDQGT